MLARKLEYLIALAKEEHFARAAAVCNVSQPALSAGIHQLEQELGIQIVKRGQRFHGLTEQGYVVLNWAQRMEVECRRLHQELRDTSGELNGTLRIGVLNSSTPFISIFTLPFSERFPNVNLRVISGSPFDIQQGIEDMVYDIAISFIQDAPSRYLRSHKLYSQRYYVLTMKGGNFSGRESVEWDELKQVPLCLYPPETHIFAPDVYEVLGTSPAGVARLETNNMFVLLDHVRSGKIVSLLPMPVLFMVAGNSEFEAIPLAGVISGGYIGIGLPNRETPSPLAESFFNIATSSQVLSKFHEFCKPKSSLAALTPHMLPTYISSIEQKS